ncbi:MAG: complex I NDUFA9 subunit family protein [Deltaproteobacteria bacterium]|nr:complex I NDUFA9 subunit family protein [Deltaproteobacteria bacterium]
MILVIGGTGFLGGNLVQILIDNHKPLKCLVREKSYHNQFQLGSVEVAYGDITDSPSLEKATESVDTVVHCVGILQEKLPHITHQKIVIEGTENLVKACLKNHVKKIIYISGLGTHENAQSLYHQAKYKAEQAIIKSGLEYVIFRPSVLIGKEDDFLNQFYTVIRFLPFFPVIGDGKYKMQPLNVHDLVSCILQTLENETIKNEIIELGGPEQLEFKDIMKIFLKACGTWRPFIHIPLSVIQFQIKFLEKLPKPFLITRDQLLMLKTNNICDNQKLHKLFHVNLTPLSEGLKEYEWYKPTF